MKNEATPIMHLKCGGVTLPGDAHKWRWWIENKEGRVLPVHARDGRIIALLPAYTRYEVVDHNG